MALAFLGVTFFLQKAQKNVTKEREALLEAAVQPN
jgi:hypothetical protein